MSEIKILILAITYLSLINQDSETGKDLVKSRCMSCHYSTNLKCYKEYLSLNRITERRDSFWITQYLMDYQFCQVNSRKKLTKQYGFHYNYTKDLRSKDVESIIQFLKKNPAFTVY